MRHGNGPWGEVKKSLSKKYILQAVDASLARLQTDYIDLYQAHKDDPTTPLEETLDAFAQLIKNGKVRAIGASNYSAERLAQALAISEKNNLPRFESLQPLYNLYERKEFETALQPLCQKHGIGVIPYFSLARGFLTGKYRSEADLSKSPRGGGVKKYLTPRGTRILAALDQLSTRLHSTPAQISLAWLMAQPAITAPIASATSLAQLHDLIAATELPLDTAAIDLLNQAKRPRSKIKPQKEKNIAGDRFPPRTTTIPIYEISQGDRPMPAKSKKSAKSKSKALSAFPPIISMKKWQSNHEELLKKEKALTHAHDALAAHRRRMGVAKIEKPYTFKGPTGTSTLLDLFEGRRQLILYHFMFAPGVGGWPNAGCPGCSFMVDQFAHPAHLHARDTSLILVSRGPLASLLRYRKRMGWPFPWFSSQGTDFNADFGLTKGGNETFGLSVFIRDDDKNVYRTYFTTRRGVETLGPPWVLLDLTPLGRQETWEKSPKGFPQTPPYQWWRRHDEYVKTK